MAEFDIAIVGTSLLSGLLAGVLARDHGKKVVHIGRQQSSQRLPRSLNLALPIATRPESWRMLRRAEADTRTLLGSLGLPDGLTATEMEVVADLPASALALDHIGHMALGSGHQVRRTGTGWAFRHVATIDHEAVEKRLPEWLRAAGVASINDGPADAGLTVLADDDAIEDHLSDDSRPGPLVSQFMTSTLVVSRPLPVPVRRFADRGVTLVTRPGGTVLALMSGEQDVEARLASTLPGPFPMKRLATTRFRRLTTADSAPVIGRVGERFIIAGLADTAAFFAPTLARRIAGTANADEVTWFAAHEPGRDRVLVAEAGA